MARLAQAGAARLGIGIHDIDEASGRAHGITARGSAAKIRPSSFYDLNTGQPLSEKGYKKVATRIVNGVFEYVTENHPEEYAELKQLLRSKGGRETTPSYRSKVVKTWLGIAPTGAESKSVALNLLQAFEKKMSEAESSPEVPPEVPQADAAQGTGQPPVGDIESKETPGDQKIAPKDAIEHSPEAIDIFNSIEAEMPDQLAALTKEFNLDRDRITSGIDDEIETRGVEGAKKIMQKWAQESYDDQGTPDVSDQGTTDVSGEAPDVSGEAPEYPKTANDVVTGVKNYLSQFGELADITPDEYAAAFGEAGVKGSDGVVADEEADTAIFQALMKAYDKPENEGLFDAYFAAQEGEQAPEEEEIGDPTAIDATTTGEPEAEAEAEPDLVDDLVDPNDAIKKKQGDVASPDDAAEIARANAIALDRDEAQRQRAAEAEAGAGEEGEGFGSVMDDDDIVEPEEEDELTVKPTREPSRDEKREAQFGQEAISNSLRPEDLELQGIEAVDALNANAVYQAMKPELEKQLAAALPSSMDTGEAMAKTMAKVQAAAQSGVEAGLSAMKNEIETLWSYNDEQPEFETFSQKLNRYKKLLKENNMKPSKIQQLRRRLA